jgi:hypothetical protein
VNQFCELEWLQREHVTETYSNEVEEQKATPRSRLLPRPFFIVHFSIYFIDCLGTDTHYSNKSHLSNTFCVFAITVVYGFDAAK